jgi:hypothetical protein
VTSHDPELVGEARESDPRAVRRPGRCEPAWVALRQAGLAGSVSLDRVDLAAVARGYERDLPVRRCTPARLGDGERGDESESEKKS